MKKTVGFFGGTFDPIHFGHINLAIQLMEIHRLDEVLFSPAYCSPFKTEAPPIASPAHRLEMVRLGLEEIPHFKVEDYEVERGEISFTIDTLRALQEEMGDEVAFRLLLSDDMGLHLNKWKSYKELIRLAPPLIGGRSLSKKTAGLEVTPTKRFEISSTEIRFRLKKGLYCGHLVPDKVLRYIKTNGLYFSLT
jgi:nicotinate-nucleotide adenylyltransferase